MYRLRSSTAYQQDCCWPSGKPNEASRKPPTTDSSLYGLALASSSSLPVIDPAQLTDGGHSSYRNPPPFFDSRQSLDCWYGGPAPNQLVVIPQPASLSPIATTSATHVYAAGQSQVGQSGSTPYESFAESGIGGLASSTPPQQLDSVFSGIDFSEV